MSTIDVKLQSVFVLLTKLGNTPPTEQRRDDIKQNLNYGRDLLAKHEKDAIHLDKLNKVLQEKRFKLHRIITHLRNIVTAQQAYISPIRWLPDDLLSEIFRYLIPTPGKGYATTDATRAPLVLTHVCRRWRQLVHNTPQVWSSLHVEPVDSDDWTPYDEDRYNFVSKWLERADAMPLSVSFARSPPYRLCLVDLGHLLECLPTSATWNRFEATFMGPRDDIIRILDAQDDQSPLWLSPKLSLTMHVQAPVGSSGFHVHHTSAVQSAMEHLKLTSNKNLRELSLRCSNFKPEGTIFSSFLPCQRLQVLDLQDPEGRPDFQVPGEVAYELLRNCPNLVSFAADLEGTTPGSAIPTSPFVMKKMKHLSLSLFDFATVADVEPWLPWLEFPALESLHLRNRERLQRRVRPSVPETMNLILQKVTHTLTALTLDPGAITRDDLIDALASLPHLVQLHIKQVFFDEDFDVLEMKDEYRFTDELLNELTPTGQPGDHPLCPHLQYLRWQHNTCFSDDALSAFLYARASPSLSPVPMKEVHIDFGRKKKRDIVPDWTELVDGGLKLRLRYLPNDGKEARNVRYDAKKHKYLGGTTRALPLVEEAPLDGFGWTDED